MILFGMSTFSQQQIQEIRDIRSSQTLPGVVPAWYVALESVEQAEVILLAYFIDLFEPGSHIRLIESLQRKKCGHLAGVL